MNTLKKTLRTVQLAATAALLLAACTEAPEATTETGGDGALSRVALTVSDGQPTRTAGENGDGGDATETRAASAADVRRSAFLASDQIYLYMPDALARAGAVYSVATGGATAVPKVAGEAVIAPHDGQSHALYGYYPHESSGQAVMERSAVFTVQQDQTTADGYRLSDLMTADAATVTGSGDGQTATVTTTTTGDGLVFRHRMAKLVLRPYSASDGTDGTDELRVKRVTLLSGYRTVSLTQPAGTPGTTLSDQITPQQPLTVFSSNDADDDDTNNSMSVPVRTEDWSDAAGSHDDALVCLVPPQTLTALVPLIRVETTGGDIITYRMNTTTPEAAHTLEGGRAYRLDLPVAPLTATVDIADWTPVTWGFASGTDAGTYSAEGSLSFTVGSQNFLMCRVPKSELPATSVNVYTTDNMSAATGARTWSVPQQTVDEFWMGQTEVTEGLWRAVMGNVTDIAATMGDDYPAADVTYTEACSFLDALNSATATQRPAGYVFAIPTMAQWSNAFRGGPYDAGYTYSGSSDYNAVAVYGTAARAKVGTKDPNQLGIYDMSGNVYEYVCDGELATAGQTDVRLVGGASGDNQTKSLRRDFCYYRGISVTGVWRGLRVALVRLPDYFAVTATGAADITVTPTLATGYTMHYSTNGMLWTAAASGTGIPVAAGQTLYLRSGAGTAAAPVYPATGSSAYTTIKFNDADVVSLSGHVMSLAKQSGFEGAGNTMTSGTFNFFGLFYESGGTIDASRLTLADNVTANCYHQMFNKCTGLTAAPALPATVLAESCYKFMFAKCTGLSAAPALPATTLAASCYYCMFSNCTGLSAAPALPATTLAASCYLGMFTGCTGLTSAPALPATTLAAICYSQMFYGCTSLTTAPALPATTLAASCYYRMFYGCKRLTSAPALPATTLANYCYESMFYNCTSLPTAPALPATVLAPNCYFSMFQNCTGLTAAPALPATVLANNCYFSMFNGCTGLTAAPALPATTLATYCYNGMFQNCTGLTAAPALPATVLAERCYYSMFQNCTGLTAAPALPATVLAERCYNSMFNGCSSLTTIHIASPYSNANNEYSGWLSGVKSSGTIYYKDDSWSSATTGASGVPSGWTKEKE